MPRGAKQKIEVDLTLLRELLAALEDEERRIVKLRRQVELAMNGTGKTGTLTGALKPPPGRISKCLELAAKHRPRHD